MSYTTSHTICCGTPILTLLVQDTLCLVAPYPFRLEPLEEFDPLSDLDMTGGDDIWYARQQLFFSCTLCPTGQMEDKASHLEFSLVFFSTFEPISLTPDSCMQRNGPGIPMLYERAASQLQTLYVCPRENVLGRVPLMLATSKGTFTTQFLTPLGTRFLMARLPIPGQTAGQAACFSRSTFGCGAMGGRSPERSQWRMLRRCCGSVFKSQGAGEPKP